jgi:hypothetical protein
MSKASACGVSYLRRRSASIAFRVIQSRSPRRSRTRLRGSVWRALARTDPADPRLRTSVLGGGGVVSRSRRGAPGPARTSRCAS